MRVSVKPWEKNISITEEEQLMEQVVERENMKAAYKRVKQNKGAPGIDGMTVEELGPYLRKHWPHLKDRLCNGSYEPQAVRRVEIPKAGGGKRLLGIPTVLDRLIQQAVHQILSPLYEPGFSEHSYGFRPRRNAHQAVLRAREYQSEGKRWVVDLDLKQFFDEVNHDILMARIGRRINDRRVVRLIRKYLRAGLMVGGIISKREKGTPQGGPLSPLLSNILLDDLDKELERRGHSFCRYADDCNIYVRSRRAGERVLKSITVYVERRLKLKVNQEKSAVDRPWRRKFLGYTFSCHRKPRIYVSRESVKRFKSKLKALFRQGRGRNLFRFIREVLNPVLRGWMQYYQLAESRGFAEELDQWIRRRLRGIIWRQWKRPRKRFQMLCRLGIQKERAARSAGNQRGPWFNAGASHMSQACPCIFFTRLGLLSLLDTLRKLGPVLT